MQLNEILNVLEEQEEKSTEKAAKKEIVTVKARTSWSDQFQRQGKKGFSGFVCPRCEKEVSLLHPQSRGKYPFLCGPCNNAVKGVFYPFVFPFNFVRRLIRESEGCVEELFKLVRKNCGNLPAFEKFLKKLERDGKVFFPKEGEVRLVKEGMM